MSNFSVVILTLNEERNLPACLRSVASCDDVVVLDSGSTDRTAEIARQAGARVFVRKFDSFGGQRNHAQRHIAFRHPWVFHLDADEHFTPELVAECRTASERRDVDGFMVAPKMMWQGHWLPHCTDFPAYQARFVRAPEFEFIDVGHGQREAPHMRMGKLKANYLHDMSANGEADWIEKHRRYARKEAERALSVPLPPLRAVFDRDPLLRRRAMKAYASRLPARPFFRFVYQYVLRRGFLDGAVALHYCRLVARYDRFISEEIRTLRNARKTAA